MRPLDPSLLRQIPASRAPVAALSAAGVLGGALAVAQAVCLAWLASAVVTGGPLAAPLTWTIALLVARGLVSGAQQWLSGWAGQRVASGVRVQLLSAWSGRPVGARPDADEAVTRATDGVAGIEPYVARYLPALVTAAVVPVLSVLTLVVVDAWAALIVVLTLPLLPLFAALIGQHTQHETQRRWSAMSDLAGHFLDVVRGLPTLVNYGRAERQVAVVGEVGHRHRVATVQTLRTAFLSTVALELLATISVALVAVCVGLRLAYGAMDLQVAMTAILLAPEAYWPIRRVGSEFHNAADGALALERLTPDLAQGPAAPHPRPCEAPQPSGVVLDSVTFHHAGRADTLSGMSLATGPGVGLTALTGPSGAGKTTVLELLAGLREPTTGCVLAPPAHLATQRPLLLPGTVRDNLALASPTATDGEMRLALGRVGLWDALQAREGLDTVLGDDGFGLSAGQRGRLGLARAILSDAPLVLLDEPTAHIAPHALPDLRAVIVALARRRRVITATHDTELAALAGQQWAIPLQDRAVGQAEIPRPVAAGTPPQTAAEPTPGTTTRDTTGTTAATPTNPPTWLERRLPSPRARLRLAAVIGGLATASGVALTATSGWLIVQASYQPVVLTLLVAIVGVRAFGLARPVLRYAERLVSHDVALEVLARERTSAYARLIPLTPARLGRRSRGDVLTAVVRDLDDVTDEKVRVVVPAWDTALASVVAALVIGAFLPLAGLIVAGAGALIFLLGWAEQRIEQRSHRRLVAARGSVRRLTALVTAQLSQVQAVTGIGRADVIVDRVGWAQHLEDDAARELSRTRGITVSLTWCVIAAAVGAVAWLAGAAFTAGTLTGPLAALVALTPMALADAWAGVPEIFGARARAHAARQRLVELFSQEPAVAQVDSTSASLSHVPALSAQALEATWGARHEEPDLAPTDRAMHDLATPDLAPVDLHVRPSEKVVLTGPNGVGKSTLLAVLARHLDPAAGTYRHDATDVRRLSLTEVRQRCAVADDEPHAFHNTVRANLDLALPGASDDAMIAAVHTADLGHWFARLPQGLDTVLTGLSGGERTRLSLARGILSGRPVLLLDEPTAHLDEVSATRVLDHLGTGPQSAVMVSHDTRPQGWREVRLTAPGQTATTSASTHRDLSRSSARSR